MIPAVTQLRPYFRRAADDTTAFKARRNVLSGLGTSALTLLALALWGSETATEDYLLALGAGVVGGVLIPGLFSYLWNLAAAPVRLARADATAERTRREELEAEKAAAVDRNAEVKLILRERLAEGGRLRGSIVTAIRPMRPIGPHVPMIDQWIATAEVEVRSVAPEWLAYFVSDTGDMPKAVYGMDMQAFGRMQQEINEAHLSRLDRHMERLREIVYERL